MSRTKPLDLTLRPPSALTPMMAEYDNETVGEAQDMMGVTSWQQKSDQESTRST
jgi:hypothetical protein